MVKKVTWLAILALALPLAAFANSIDLANAGGVVIGNSGGLALTGSTLIKYGSTIANNLGSVTFTTGAFTSGDIDHGGTLMAGGNFVITGNGTNGVPNGVIFNGSFSGPVTWSLMTLENGTHVYTLSGALAAANGEVGATAQLTINTGTALFSGSAQLSSGDTNLTVTVPEPGTLSLLGTGLIGVAGFMRRKRWASRV
jgi:PEP-CTERM motif